MSGKMTLEKLAEISQREFLAIREEMVGMKKELKGDIAILKEDIAILRRDTEAGFGAMSQGMKAIMEKLNQVFDKI